MIAGLIQDHEYWHQKIKPSIDNQQVTYIGNCGPKERDTVLGNALALLHPINFDEPFGLSVAESMCAGTPVIAYNRGAMPELIVDAKTGFLVSNVESAVAAVKKLRSIDRRSCRRHVETNFSQDKMIEDYLKVYQQILFH